VLAVSQTDVPGRLETLKNATARLTDGSLLPIVIDSAWPHDDLWVFKFSGVDSISDAERFRGAELCVASEKRGKLADGEYFRSDLIGCVVVEKPGGRTLGEVTGWQQYGGPPLMEVLVNGHKTLIPFVPSICQEVDVTGRKIVVEVPEGLLEL
jgi:16S rRNA processing protein RimM